MTTFQYAKLAPSGVKTELLAEEQEPPPRRSPTTSYWVRTAYFAH